MLRVSEESIPRHIKYSAAHQASFRGTPVGRGMPVVEHWSRLGVGNLWPVWTLDHWMWFASEFSLLK